MMQKLEIKEELPNADMGLSIKSEFLLYIIVYLLLGWNKIRQGLKL
jgi:hypothetical protein